LQLLCSRATVADKGNQITFIQFAEGVIRQIAPQNTNDGLKGHFMMGYLPCPGAKNNYQKQIGSLKEILLTLNAYEIEGFNNRFIALLDTSYNWNLWGAAYVINGGCSEDCFIYFRYYLIAHGKEKFLQYFQ